MKRSYQQKRNQDSSLSNEYNDISNINDDLLATLIVTVSEATT